MAMSTKDYVIIAAVLAREYKSAQPGAVRLGVWNVANRLADCFAGGNPLFDPDRFIKAACPEENEPEPAVPRTCILTAEDIALGRDEDCTMHDHEDASEVAR